MPRRAAALAVLALAAAASAQTGPVQARFRWQAGQQLRYRVETSTAVSEVADGATTETATKAAIDRLWRVTAVDAAGVATLQLTIQRLKTEVTKPDGETIAFDSDKPDEANRDLMKLVNVPIAELRVDSFGRVLEVKKSDFGPASRYESDPPFKLVFPEGAFAAGQAWERPYAIKLEPPQGAGESFAAVQQIACTAAADGKATFALTTTLKQEPALAERVPLLQHQPAGTVTFDLNRGLYLGAKLAWEKAVEGHAGTGSKYTFKGTFAEEFVEK